MTRRLITRYLLLGGMAALIVLGAAILWFKPSSTVAVQEVEIAVSRSPNSALVVIADRLGLFRQEGLRVTLSQFGSGKQALDSMMRGEADLATASETPITLAILAGQPVVAVAGIFSGDENVGVLARRDRGIATPRDLRGKRVGTPLGTTGQYFLHLLLTVGGIPPAEVTVIGMRPEAMASALAADKIDAVAVWDPHLLLLRDQLGANSVTFYGDHIYTQSFALVATRPYAADHPQTIRRLLRALEHAEAAIRDRPMQARRIVAESARWDEELLAAVWNKYRFRLGLDPVLLTAMEQQATWAIRNGLANPQTTPNLLDFIYFDGLRSVAPRRITLVQ